MNQESISKEFYKDKKVTVMGLGLFGGGVVAARFLVSQGADVTVTDLKSAEELSASLKLLNDLSVKLRLGKHSEEDFADADMLVVNPAVPDDSRFLQIACDNNVQIDSELNIFFRFVPAPVIGITGSNGKSTTTSLLGEMLKEAGIKTGIKTWIGGNIGVSLLGHLDEIQPDDVVVLEISSFQLELLSRIEMSPHISIVTNIAPNHLDRHKTMENYINSKKAIIRYQKKNDYAILNYDDPTLREWEGECKSHVLWFSATKELEHGAFLKDNEIIINHNFDVISCPTQTNIKGIHNRQNIMAASYAAIAMNVDVGSIKNAIAGFNGLEHRLEYVNTINDVQYYNDSKATTPEAAIAGIKAFDNPTILIAGGYNKEVSLSQFARECAKNTKNVILVGETAINIQELIKNVKGEKDEKAEPEVYVATSLDESVKKAYEIAEAGDVVLLSPACASFDMFINYEERGKRFKELVHNIKN
ncbi:MAG: UDP-N-acetylmuramoylalanine--D-glutamate ligase [Candidatus Scalindua arabica]|uniref:UDP-N-acetylmuramoylalanine--D-glutamate ligase n=1 Tax=Candidatus Scalindua arabica TaxID=1127984 RepID=A0A941W4H6_9BACT|nr:UDP-N-acetylmuramoylalanine--D-glutamate ligase [Candidatus Scalindua arabica]